MPIVVQCTFVSVGISKDCSWDAHTVTKLQHSESTRRQDGKGEAHIGKVDAILTDSHLDIRIRNARSEECDCTESRACRRRMGREREVRKTAGNSADDIS